MHDPGNYRGIITQPSTATVGEGFRRKDQEKSISIQFNRLFQTHLLSTAHHYMICIRNALFYATYNFLMELTLYLHHSCEVYNEEQYEPKRVTFTLEGDFGEEQHRFRKGRGTAYGTYAMRHMVEKRRTGQYGSGVRRPGKSF